MKSKNLCRLAQSFHFQIIVYEYGICRSKPSEEEDARREKVLSALGLRIVRFRNDEVVRDVSAAVGKIKLFLLEYTLTQGDP